MVKNRKLKIAVWHNLPSGGGKRALYQHVKGLTERGHSVESWCPSSANTTYLPLTDFAAEHVLPFEWENPSASGRLKNILYPYRSIETKLRAMKRHSAECAEEISAKNFDVLFANTCMFFRVPFVARTMNAKRLPAVLYLQEPYRWLYEALPDFPWVALPSAESLYSAPKNLKRFLRDSILFAVLDSRREKNA